MQIDLHPTVGHQSTPVSAPERRETPRIYGPFPATARGVDIRGERFETETALDNLSASAFFLRLARSVEPGETLSVVALIHRATVALRGAVSRVEPQTDGTYGLAVEIKRYRFLLLVWDGEENLEGRNTSQAAFTDRGF